MSTFKRIVLSTLMLITVGVISTAITSCSGNAAAQAAPAGSSDQAHTDHADLLKAHDAKLGDKSTPGSLIALTSKLSDDIGIMADRILAMAREIGIMADRILVMADNIVKVIDSQTQASKDIIKLGADLALKIDTINAAGRGTSGVTLTAPISGSNATLSVPPVITYSNAAPTTKYQLLVSKSAMFPNGSTVNKLVDTAVGSTSSLATAWSQAMSDLSVTANSQLYIAVRSVDASGNPSDVSNSALLNIK